MTLEPNPNPDNYHVRQSACPYCSEPLPKQTGFADHWPDCPVNTDTTSAEHAEADR